MTIYIRNWNCGVCNEQVVYDSEKKTISCKCATIDNVVSYEFLIRNFREIELLGKNRKKEVKKK